MKRKISLEFVSIVIGAIFIFIIGATIIARNALNDTTELNLNQYLDIIETDVSSMSYQDLIDKYDDVSNHIRITIVDPTGVVLADSEADDLSSLDNHLNRPEIQNLGETYIRHSDTLDIQMMYIAKRLASNNYLRVAIPTASTLTFLNDFIGFSIIIGIVIVALAIFVSMLLIKNSLKPLKDIKTHLVDVEKGQYIDVLPVKKYDEVNGLLSEINKINHLISDQIASLKSEKNKTDFLINQMKQGICVLDENQQIIFINKFLKDIYRFNIDININKDFRFLFREELVQEAIYQAYEMKSNKQVISEKDQKYYSISINYSQENWQNKPSVIVIYSDITSIKHVEDLKRDFFVNASHELKSPLTSIIGSAELIKEGMVKDKAALDDLVSRMHQEALRMNHLVMDMLKLSELEGSKTTKIKEMIAVEHMIDDVIQNLGMLVNKHQISISKNIEVEMFEFNRDEFYQMMKNIIENAIKYSLDGGQITITIKEEDGLFIQVEDQGIGIPESDQERVFERFYRVDKARNRISGGTGLGLSIVKHIVLNANGDIKLVSKENEGTTISIKLP